MIKPETPELEKQSEIIKSGRAGLVQDFFDWLMADRELCKFDEESEQFLPIHLGGGEQVLADYFGIDRTKIEEERRAILDAYREDQ